LKIGVKAFRLGPRRSFDSCGLSAALSSAGLMTHNQLPRLVGIDAKVICNVWIGDEGRELIDTIVRGEKPAESLVMGVNQIAAQANNIQQVTRSSAPKICSSRPCHGLLRVRGLSGREPRWPRSQWSKMNINTSTWVVFSSTWAARNSGAAPLETQREPMVRILHRFWRCWHW